MTSLINKIELLIKREKTTPERKIKEPTKSSNEILSELFGAFNADPPKIEDIGVKKSKKSKKKHKKEKKKRSRSSSSSSSDDSEYAHKRKKRKKIKTKKRKSRSPSLYRTPSPPPIKLETTLKVKSEPRPKQQNDKIKKEDVKKEPKSEPKKQNNEVKIKCEDNKKEITSGTVEEHLESSSKSSFKEKIKTENIPVPNDLDATLIPMPVASNDLKADSPDSSKPDDKKSDCTDGDKGKGKIQIKNLKFSTVFEETVKLAEEVARRKAEKYEEGEYTDSSESIKEVVVNSQFPKSSDPGGILKKATEKTQIDENKTSEEKKSHKSHKSKTSDSHKSSRRRRSRSKSHKRSSSKSHRSRSRNRRHRHGSSSRSHRSRSRHRSSSHRRRSLSKSRSRLYTRHHSPHHRSRRSRSPTGVKLADSEKKRLLEVARRNAINMLKNGAVPAGAAALPAHTRNQVMAAIQSGGKSVDELTDFCKHLSKKEALGELSSVSSHDEDMSENEDTIAFHHPFLVKEKAPIVMNIRGGAPLPVKTSTAIVANKEELRMQFPVSSGTQHRENAIDWVPVSPKKDKDNNMQVAKLGSSTTKTEGKKESEHTSRPAPLALPAPPVTDPTVPSYMKSSGSQSASVPLALPAPGPQAYPPGLEPKIDMASIVSQKLQMIRKEQEQESIAGTTGFGWSKSVAPGQFTGSMAANFLTPRELASGTQAWAKKDQLTRAAPVEGGMGMALLQKMGWTPGRGLGKEGTGTLQPLLLEVKLDTKGLQAKEEIRGARRGGRGGAGGGGGAGPALAGKHPVSLLGEYCSKHKLGPPEYELCFECGPDHKKNFLFKVKVAGIEYQPAVASQNKKQAKADAAQLALQKLGILS